MGANGVRNVEGAEHGVAWRRAWVRALARDGLAQGVGKE